jgi:hypothetical protein
VHSRAIAEPAKDLGPGSLEPVVLEHHHVWADLGKVGNEEGIGAVRPLVELVQVDAFGVRPHPAPLDPAGISPQTIHSTRLIDLVNMMDAKLVAAGFGTHSEDHEVTELPVPEPGPGQMRMRA